MPEGGRGPQRKGAVSTQKGKGPNDQGQPGNDGLPENEMKGARPRTKGAVCTHSPVGPRMLTGAGTVMEKVFTS